MVINLGTNDATAASFSAAPKKIEEQYEKDYVHFLKTVRKCNGDKTKIICALGSMDYYFYDAMNRAVDTYRAETGDNNVYTFKYCRMSPMDPMTEAMKNDIAVAQRLGITATTLEGILTVKGQGRR